MFRRIYLRECKCDVLALLETNCCSAEEEEEWAKDWKGQSFWASQYRDTSLEHAGSHRGVVILIRESPQVYGKGRVVARDPNGRFLAVSIPIYGRPTLLIALHADCGTSHAASFHAARLAITPPPGTLDTILLTDSNNYPTVMDHISYAPRPAGGPLPPPPGNASSCSRERMSLHTVYTSARVADK